MLKLHNAMWPGTVGKGEGADEPAISLENMLKMTTRARVEGNGFDGIDLNIMAPHLDIDAEKDKIIQFADNVAGLGLKVGSVGAPVWGPAGGGSSMGSREERKRFLEMVKKTCAYAQVLNAHGVREYGSIRIDSADSPENWAKDPVNNTKLIAETFREAARIAGDHGERLAAEGEICWAGMHSWKHMRDLLEEVGMPDQLGFQADLAHTYLFMMGYNAPGHALLGEGYSTEEFWEAYKKLTAELGPWTIDFHVAQSNGTVFGSGSHDKTGRHCTADAPDGRLDVVKCARYWLLDGEGKMRNHIRHVCWDGCMFPNAVLESATTWDQVLALMLEVRNDIEGQLKG